MSGFIDFWLVLVPRHMPFLLQGAVVTLELSLVSMVFAILIGLLCAIGRMSGSRVINAIVATYVEVVRDVPLIVLLLVIFFTLPQIGISLPGFWAGVLGLSLNVGAYLSEVFRAALGSVDPGQRDAGLSIGMSRFTVFRRVSLPQAMVIAVPTIGGYFISLLKDCALVSFIAVEELLRQGKYIIAENFRSMETYLLIGAIYFVMSFTSARVIRRLEIWLRPAYLRKS
jgi:His/Glu/Gln/Arg/opine family amino acid ABC transporter permease subunit